MKQPTNHKSNTPWTESDIDTLADMYKCDVSVKTIARALGRTEAAVYNAVHKNGIKRPPKQPEGDAHLQMDMFAPEREVLTDNALEVQRDIPREFYTYTWDKQYTYGLTISTVVIALLILAVAKGIL